MHTNWNFNKQQYVEQSYETEKKRVLLHNEMLELFCKPKFKLYELALLDKKHVVIITKIEPKGYILQPARFDINGSKKFNALVRDVDIYQYRHIGTRRSGSNSDWHGQTIESSLTKIED